MDKSTSVIIVIVFLCFSTNLSNGSLFKTVKPFPSNSKEKVIEIIPFITTIIDNCSLIAEKLDPCYKSVYSSLSVKNEIKANCCLPFMISNCLKPIIMNSCNETVYEQFMIDVDNYRNSIKPGLCLRYTFLLDCESPIPQTWLLLTGVLIVTSLICIAIWFLLRSSNKPPQVRGRSTYELRSESFRLINFKTESSQIRS